MDWEPPEFWLCKQTEKEGDTTFICSTVTGRSFSFLKPRVLKFFFPNWVFTCIHQCRAAGPLIIVFHDFAIVLIISFLLSLSIGLSPKNRTKTFNNIVCFCVVLCVDHKTIWYIPNCWYIVNYIHQAHHICRYIVREIEREIWLPNKAIIYNRLYFFICKLISYFILLYFICRRLTWHSILRLIMVASLCGT